MGSVRRPGSANKNQQGRLTTSHLPGTTLDFVRISLPSLRQGIFDTPGLIIPSQAWGMHMHMHTHTRMRMHMHMHMQMRVHMRMRMHMHVHMHMHMHVRMHMHMHVHMHYSSPRHPTHTPRTTADDAADDDRVERHRA